MKPRIALVQPFFDTVIVTPPIGIGYLSSYLKSYGYDVILIDALKDNLKEEDVFRILQTNKIDILGITCASLFYKEVVNLSLYVKEHDKKIKIVIGVYIQLFCHTRRYRNQNATMLFAGKVKKH